MKTVYKLFKFFKSKDIWKCFDEYYYVQLSLSKSL